MGWGWEDASLNSLPKPSQIQHQNYDVVNTSGKWDRARALKWELTLLRWDSYFLVHYYYVLGTVLTLYKNNLIESHKNCDDGPSGTPIL